MELIFWFLAWALIAFGALAGVYCLFVFFDGGGE